MDFGVHRLDRAHILCNFGTEVGAVDHALMPVRVGAVCMVAVKDERRTGFHRRFQDEAHQLFYRDFPFGNSIIVDTILVAFFPFFAVKVFQRIAFYRENFVRAHQVPRGIDVLIDGAPEEVGAAHRREHIVRLHAVVAVIGTEL